MYGLHQTYAICLIYTFPVRCDLVFSSLLTIAIFQMKHFELEPRYDSAVITVLGDLRGLPVWSDGVSWNSGVVAVAR